MNNKKAYEVYALHGKDFRNSFSANKYNYKFHSFEWSFRGKYFGHYQPSVSNENHKCKMIIHQIHKFDAEKQIKPQIFLIFEKFFKHIQSIPRLFSGDILFLVIYLLSNSSCYFFFVFSLLQSIAILNRNFEIRCRPFILSK